MKNTFPAFTFILFFFISSGSVVAGGKWYNFYEDGIKFMQMGNWSQAIVNFNEALKVKDRDTKQIKTYGMHFIEYFPHREKGICFYQLGRVEEAKSELSLSLHQEYSPRAQEFLAKLGGAPPPIQPTELPIIPPQKNDMSDRPISDI